MLLYLYEAHFHSSFLSYIRFFIHFKIGLLTKGYSDELQINITLYRISRLCLKVIYYLLLSNVLTGNFLLKAVKRLAVNITHFKS